jgi:hypothetical protein
MHLTTDHRNPAAAPAPIKPSNSLKHSNFFLLQQHEQHEQHKQQQPYPRQTTNNKLKRSVNPDLAGQKTTNNFTVTRPQIS